MFLFSTAENVAPHCVILLVRLHGTLGCVYLVPVTCTEVIHLISALHVHEQHILNQCHLWRLFKDSVYFKKYSIGRSHYVKCKSTSQLLVSRKQSRSYLITIQNWDLCAAKYSRSCIFCVSLTYSSIEQQGVLLLDPKPATGHSLRLCKQMRIQNRTHATKQRLVT